MSETQKTAVVFGVANKRSIAWAIAQKLSQAGWRLAITYQNERLEQEAKGLIEELPGAAVYAEMLGIAEGQTEQTGVRPEGSLP